MCPISNGSTQQKSGILEQQPGDFLIKQLHKPTLNAFIMIILMWTFLFKLFIETIEQRIFHCVITVWSVLGFPGEKQPVNPLKP